MRRIPIPLLLPIIVIAFPVALPIAIVLYIRDRRRMQVVAERTRCECCGAMLGVTSLRGADTEWTRRAAALRHTQLMMRLRLIRHVWAICVACGAEYDYDAGAHTFIARMVAATMRPRSAPPRNDLPVSGPSASGALRRQMSSGLCEDMELKDD
jgi:uncharacterized protein (DUF2062 family)